MLKRTKTRLKRTKRTPFTTFEGTPAKCEACFIEARNKGLTYTPELTEGEYGFIYCKCGRLADFGTNEKLLISKGMNNGK